MKSYITALALGAAAVPGVAAAQQVQVQVPPIHGTRLDISASGEASRVPDVAIISAGVVTRSATASGAIGENSARMERVIAALKSAGVADRDIQTSNINLNPDYAYENNRPPRLTGYNASNQVTVKFRDIANAGEILDALVAEGANSINGPTLTIDKPQAALDEARTRAIAAARGRAELYARSLGMRVVRVVAVSESGGFHPVPPPMPMMRAEAADASTKIDPGEQTLQVNVAMTFELQ